MRSRNTQRIFILLTALAVFVLGSVGTFAQGKGHGNKHGGGREDRGNRGGQNENRGNGNWKHQDRQENWRGRGNGNGKHQDRQENWQGRGNGNGNGRWQREQRVEQRQYQQPRYDREQRQGWRVEQRRPRIITATPDYPVYQPQRNYGQWKKQQRENDRGWGWNNYGYRNYGQYRSDEVHRRNAERKAWKNVEKESRYYERSYPRYSYHSQYYPRYEYNGYGYQIPRRVRANILRSFIVDNSYSYYPVSYTTRYYRSSPTYYRSYAATPSYYVYRPVDPYYADNYYDNVSVVSYPDYAGGGFAQQVFSNLLAMGYEQGYVQGLNARRRGYRDQNYYDPYDYEGTNYLSSSSLGQTRSCLSDGYELGYNDALYNRDSQAVYEDTNVDLVSLLIGQALQVL